jgi:hypothetical protein
MKSVILTEYHWTVLLVALGARIDDLWNTPTSRYENSLVSEQIRLLETIKVVIEEQLNGR